MTLGLSFVDVTRRYGKRRAIADLDLDFPLATMTCLVGPNGAGKSTALALAAGLISPTRGSVLVGQRLVDTTSAPASTGYLPQRSAFHPSLKVAEVLHFTRAARDASPEDVDRALEVTGLDDVMQRSVGELSGGWVRRLGLLSALLGAPSLLLLDEPFVGLDPRTLDRLLVHLEQRLSSGATLVIASHSFEVLDRFRPRVAVFEEGRLRSIQELPRDGSGSSRDLYRRALRIAPLFANSGARPIAESG